MRQLVRFLVISLLFLVGCGVPTAPAVQPTTTLESFTRFIPPDTAEPATLPPVVTVARLSTSTLIPTATITPTRTISPTRTITQPTKTVQPTNRRAPTATQATQPTKALAPVPTSAPVANPTTPSSGIRTGAVCKDGTTSTATGSGACSHHGGVAYWTYR